MSEDTFRLIYLLGVGPSFLICYRWAINDVAKKARRGIRVVDNQDRGICAFAAMGGGIAWPVWVPLWLAFRLILPVLRMIGP